MTDPVSPAPLPAPAPKDIHELKAVLKALDAFVILLGTAFKDGAQVTDLVTILTVLATDPIYKTAAAEFKEIMPEIKDLNLPEGIELLVILVTAVPKYFEAFKKGNLVELLA